MLSPSFCWLPTRATNANVSFHGQSWSKAFPPRRRSDPEEEMTRCAIRIFLQLPCWRGKHSVGPHVTFVLAYLKTKWKKNATHSHINNSAFMRKQRQGKKIKPGTKQKRWKLNREKQVRDSNHVVVGIAFSLSSCFQSKTMPYMYQPKNKCLLDWKWIEERER